MADQRDDIAELRLQLAASIRDSGTTPGGKCIAALTAAAQACKAANMPPELAVHMLKSFYRHDPLE